MGLARPHYFLDEKMKQLVIITEDVHKFYFDDDHVRPTLSHLIQIVHPSAIFDYDIFNDPLLRSNDPLHISSHIEILEVDAESI